MDSIASENGAYSVQFENVKQEAHWLYSQEEGTQGGQGAKI